MCGLVNCCQLSNSNLIAVLRRCPLCFLQDEDELFKIHAFISLTAPFRHVVIPVLRSAIIDNAATSSQSSQLLQAKWDEETKNEVEQWPIVQAYGLDGQSAVNIAWRALSRCCSN